MSLLTIVKNVANDTGLLEVPTTVVSNSNPGTQQVLSLINKVCGELLRAHDWQALQREITFTTDGSGSYNIDTDIVTDGDYKRPVMQTEWDRSNQKKIAIVSEAEWQELKSGIVSTTGIYRYARVRGNNLIMTPDESGDDLSFEYISSYYVKDSAGDRKPAFTDDTDTVFFDEDLVELGLIYHLQTRKGLPAEEDYDIYNNAINDLSGQEKPQKVLRPCSAYKKSNFVLNIPDSGVGQ